MVIFDRIKPWNINAIIHFNLYRINLTILVVQQSFQLYIPRSFFGFFYIDGVLVRTSDSNNNKKKVLPSFIKVKALLFLTLYRHVNFPCVLHLETIPYARKSFIVHNKVVFILKFYFLETSYIKTLKNHNCFSLSINIWKKKHLYSYLDCKDMVWL